MRQTELNLSDHCTISCLVLEGYLLPWSTHVVISAEISLGDSVDDHMARVTENNKIKFIIQDGVFVLKVYALRL